MVITEGRGRIGGTDGAQEGRLERAPTTRTWEAGIRGDVVALVVDVVVMVDDIIKVPTSKDLGRRRGRRRGGTAAGGP